MRRFVIILLFALQLFTPQLNAQTFHEKPRLLNDSNAFVKRDGSGLDSYLGKLWLTGGWNNEVSPVTDNQFWSSWDGVTFTRETDPPWTRRHSHGHGVKDSLLWIFGGDLFTGSYQKDVWTFNGTTWTLVTNDWGSVVGDRILFAYCIHKNYLYVAGGQSTGETETSVFFNDVARTADGITWTKVGDFPPGMGPRSTAPLLSLGGALYMIGGGVYDDDEAEERVYYNDVWRSTDDGATWTQISNGQFLATQYPSAYVWNNKMWLLVGAIWTENQTGLIWSFDGIIWNKYWYDFIPARHATPVTVHANELYFVSGNLWNDSYKITDIRKN